jgi:hypothetical protein
VLRMPWSVLRMRVDEDINVDQEQSSPP